MNGQDPIFSSTVDPRWKVETDKLRLQLQELDSEAERQKLMDELSSSQTKNAELERALASVVREKERISILERERILRRAQVAQATAQMVYEANWARSQMESEMKQAKLRAMIFGDPVITSESVAAAVCPPKSISVNALSPMTGTDDHPVKETPSTVYTILAAVHSVSDNASSPVQATSPELALPTTAATVQEAPVAPTIEGISSMVSSAAENVFSNILSSYYLTEGSKENSQEKSQAVKSMQNLAKDPQPPPILPSITPSPDVPSFMKSTLTKLLIPSDPPKMDTVNKPPPALKKIPTFQKGQWSVPELQENAEVLASAMLHEKEELLAKNTSLFVELYGLPKREYVPPVEIDAELIDLQAEWLKQVAPIQVPRVSGNAAKDSTEALIQQSIGVAGSPETKASRGPVVTTAPVRSNDKKNCLIM